MEQPNTFLSSLQTLPKLPTELHQSQCIAFQDEILVCGGVLNNDCYSYHIKKRQYKLICSYPCNIQLQGHTVVVIDSNLNSSNFLSSSSIINTTTITTTTTTTTTSSSSSSSSFLSNKDIYNSITLLSFGGFSKSTYHTMWMRYKSVWDNNETKLSSSLSSLSSPSQSIFPFLTINSFNQWISMQSKHSILGEKQQHDLEGARALIGGSYRHLLFITRFPKNIDVIDLRSFQYLNPLIKGNVLPVSKNTIVWFHCFIPANKRNENEFILMVEGETLLLRYDENCKEFSYYTLTTCFSLKNCYDYAYACYNNRLFVFGGLNTNQKCMDEIWMFEMKEKKWIECDIKMPFAIKGAVAVVSEYDSSIHIIGGSNDSYEDQDTHYMKAEYTLKKVRRISEYWIRSNKVKRFGWIKELDNIVLEYL